MLLPVFVVFTSPLKYVRLAPEYQRCLLQLQVLPQMVCVINHGPTARLYNQVQATFGQHLPITNVIGQGNNSVNIQFFIINNRTGLCSCKAILVEQVHHAVLL